MSEVLVTQIEEPVWWHRTQTWIPWGLLASQSNLNVGFQVSRRPCHNTKTK